MLLPTGITTSAPAPWRTDDHRLHLHGPPRSQTSVTRANAACRGCASHVPISRTIARADVRCKHIDLSHVCVTRSTSRQPAHCGVIAGGCKCRAHANECRFITLWRTTHHFLSFVRNDIVQQMATVTGNEVQLELLSGENAGVSTSTDTIRPSRCC